MNAQCEAAIVAAGQECLAHGRATGHEMAIMLDATGKVMAKKEGEDTQVGFTTLELILWKCDGLAVMIHNHPGYAYSLSPADIQMATKLDCEIIAFTEDGGVYRSKGIAAESEEDVDRMNEITNKVIAPEVDKPMPSLTLPHDVNIALYQAGLLRSYDYTLGASHLPQPVGA